MIFVFILAISIFVIGFILKSAWFKGWFAELQGNLIARYKGWEGEAIVNLVNWFYLDKKVYHMLRNVTLPTEDGTTQIDHIIVSQYGIFVVETKNRSGRIYGRKYEYEWTVKLGCKKYYPQNPLRQNAKHIKTLSELLGLPENKFWSLIAFTGESIFERNMPENVANGGRPYLAYIKSRNEIILSEKEIAFVLEKIKAYRLSPTMATSRQHIKHVQDIKNRKTAASRK